MNYLLAFALAMAFGLLLTPVARFLALKFGAVDHPTGGRKIHTRPTPRWGGLAIAGAFTITALVWIVFDRQLASLLGGALIVLIVGVIDDVRPLGAWVKLAWQVVAAVVVLAGGIGIYTISSPAGGVIALDWFRTAIQLGGLSFHITPVANLLSILWIVGMINAVNFMDGVDGLADGVSAIASFCLFLLAVSVDQPVVAILALALTGACLGFLPYNFYPAKIFLGDSGAYFLGLVLAVLAIYSGGKLATASLVLGFTIIDGLLTVLRRLYNHKSPFEADRTHMHHLLLDMGLSQRQTVAVYYLVAGALGVLALFSGTVMKLVIIGLLALGTATLAAVLIRRSKTTS